MQLIKVLLIPILFYLQVSLSFAISLRERITLEQFYPQSQLTSEVRNQVSGHHLVLVSGVMNELAALVSSYYASNISAAKHLNMTYSLINPPSSGTISDNAERLYLRITGNPHASSIERRDGIHRNSGKPLVLMAHSKGGAEAMLMILRHPDLITHHIIDRVIILQGAMGGSPLAEPEHQSYLMRAVASLVHGGFQSLQPARIQPIFQEALEDSFEAGLAFESERTGVDTGTLLKEVSDKIFYVLADKTHGEMGPGIGLVLAVVGDRLDRFGPNDGLVLLKDQVLKSRSAPVALGRVLARLPIDHIGASVKYFSDTDDAYKKALMNALFAHVFDTSGAVVEDMRAVDLIQAQSRALERGAEPGSPELMELKHVL